MIHPERIVRRDWSLIVLAAVVAVVATGCYATRYNIRETVTPLGSERTYPATPDSAQIPLYATSKPECAYDEVAAITVEATDGQVALETLRKRVRSLGGQAVVGYTQASHPDYTVVRAGTAV